jgi:hypothetical protein
MRLGNPGAGRPVGPVLAIGDAVEKFGKRGHHALGLAITAGIL